MVHGRAALRARLAPVLAELAPAVSCAALVDYWFRHDAHVDDRLLRELDGLRRDGVEVHLATVQEHERAAYLWDRLNAGGTFEALHYAAALGCAKPAPRFYRAIEARTGLPAEAIFFIDDQAANVAGARVRLDGGRVDGSRQRPLADGATVLDRPLTAHLGRRRAE